MYEKKDNNNGHCSTLQDQQVHESCWLGAGVPLGGGWEDVQGIGFAWAHRLLLDVVRKANMTMSDSSFLCKKILKVKIMSQASLTPCGWRISLAGYWVEGEGRREGGPGEWVLSCTHGCPWDSVLHGHRNHRVTSAIPARQDVWSQERASPPLPHLSQSAQSVSVESLCVCSIFSTAVGQSYLYSSSQIPEFQSDCLSYFPLGFWVLHARPPCGRWSQPTTKLLVWWEEAWCEGGAASELWEQ